MTTERLRAAHHASAACLARDALGVLRGTESTTVVAGHLRTAQARPPGSADTDALSASAGAVRMLGADVLAGYFLTGRPPVPEEWAAVQRCLSALPPAPQPPPAPPAGAEPSWLRAWVDWGLATVLDRLGPATAARPPMPVPLPPPRCVPSAPRRRTAGPGQAGEGWVPWSLRMGRLASLALPGLDSVLHEAARSAPLALARGAARAVLRRDYATAARITRWLAWLEAEGAAPLVDASLLVREITLRGPEDSRCALDVAIARHLLERTNT